MTQSLSASEAILSIADCAGTLTWNHHSCRVEGSLSVQRSGQTTFAVAQMPNSRDMAFLDDIFHASHGRAEALTLSVRDRAGRAINTSHAYITRLGHDSDEHGTATSIEAACFDTLVTLPWDGTGTPAANHVEYHLSGLRCWPPVTVSRPECTYGVQGVDHRIVAPEHGGLIAIDWQCEQAPDVTAIDRTVERLLQILSFANGRTIAQVARRSFLGVGGIELYLRGRARSTRARWPAIPYLAMHSAVNAALENYTDEVRMASGIDVAISWSLAGGQYAEAEYLGLMTAIEHLLHVSGRSHAPRGIIDRDIFKRSIAPPLRARLSELLAGTGCLSGDQRHSLLVNRIAALNEQSSFKIRLLEYLRKQRVPSDDLLPHISRMIRVRNAIIHEGLAIDESGHAAVNEIIPVAREMVTRIVLQTIAYSGPYESYLQGNQLREFPPCAASP